MKHTRLHLTALAGSLLLGSALAAGPAPGSNPLLRDVFTADPRITQTFTPAADIALGRISLYAGDGHGTQPGQPLRIALLDLGADGTGPGASLLGGDDGLALAYEPQGPGLLHIDLVGGPPVLLKAGRRYALELRAAKGAATIYARVSRGDVYAGGEALVDGRPLLDKTGKPVDLGFALYAREP